MSFQQIALWCKMEPRSLIFLLFTSQHFCVYFFLNSRRMGQCKKHGGIVWSPKSKLILRCCKGSTVSKLTSEGEIPIAKWIKRRHNSVCWNSYQWPFLQNGLFCTYRSSECSASISSGNTVRVVSCWQLGYRVTQKIKSQPARGQTVGEPSSEHCGTAARQTRTRLHGCSDISWGTCGTSLNCSCRAACCWRPRWGICSRRWVPRLGRCVEMQRSRCVSCRPRWWRENSSWVRRNGWWSAQRCRAPLRPLPRSRRCETCNSRFPLEKEKTGVVRMMHRWGDTWNLQVRSAILTFPS